MTKTTDHIGFVWEFFFLFIFDQWERFTWRELQPSSITGQYKELGLQKFEYYCGHSISRQETWQVFIITNKNGYTWATAS